VCLGLKVMRAITREPQLGGSTLGAQSKTWRRGLCGELQREGACARRRVKRAQPTHLLFCFNCMAQWQSSLLLSILHLFSPQDQHT